MLDRVRAARSLLDVPADTTTAIFGHSHGGHWALFADQLAATYAPELRIVGVAAMAPLTDLSDLVQADRSESDGILLTVLAVASWSRWYPDTRWTASSMLRRDRCCMPLPPHRYTHGR